MPRKQRKYGIVPGAARKINMAKKAIKSKTKAPVWNLKLLYTSPKDPEIEADIQAFEKIIDAFALKFDMADKKYLSDASALKDALTLYEEGIREAEKKFGLYFYFL